MITSIFKGLWTALRTPKLVLLLWTWSLLLALAAAWPARAWFGSALDVATETEALLTRFNFGTFADASKYNEMAPFGLLVATMMGVAWVALIGGAFISGGILEVLKSQGDERTFMHRFFRGGGHFFWRFVRLALCAFIPGAVVTGLVAAGVGRLTTPLMNSEWEPAGMFWTGVNLVVIGIVALWFVLALDYARIRVARDGSRGMFRAYLGGLGFVLRNAVGTYGIAIVALVVLGLLLLAYVAHEATWTTSTWAAIWILIGTQQLIMVLRSGLRVAQVSAEWHYFARSVPVVAPAPVVVLAPTIEPQPVVQIVEPAAPPQP